MGNYRATWAPGPTCGTSCGNLLETLFVSKCDLMALLWGWSAERVVLGKDLVVPFQAQPVPLLCPIWAKQPPRPSPRETLREASPSAAPGAVTQKTEDGGSSQRSRSNGVLFAQLLPRPVSGWRIHPVPSESAGGFGKRVKDTPGQLGCGGHIIATV